MTTYLDLRSEVSDELARQDLTAVLPRFQRQATQRINRDVRVSDMERRARATGTDSRYLAAPAGFLEARRLWNVVSDQNRYAEIQQVAPHKLQHKTPGGALPRYYCTHRGASPEIEFDVEVPSTREVEMVYFTAYAELSDDADTNWLLSNAYDLYFQAMLYAAERYLRNDERAALRAADYRAALEETHRAERRQHYQQPISATASQAVF